MKHINRKLVEKIKFGFVITLGAFLLLFSSVGAKAQDFRYEVDLKLSKNWSNMYLTIASDDIEFNKADKILVSSDSWQQEYLISDVVGTYLDRSVAVVEMRKKEMKKMMKSGKTFTLDFYNNGELIYKVIGVPAKGETKFFYQEIGVYWVGNFSS